MSLLGLPIEVLDLVAENLLEADLIALSGASTLLAKIALKHIWRSFTYMPEAYEDDQQDDEAKTLQPRFFTFISELEIDPITESSRCPHIRASTNGFDWRYQTLVGRVFDFVARLDDGKLRAFHWAGASCIPPELIGPGELLARTQPEIRSLRVSGSQKCFQQPKGSSLALVDLSAFRQLRHLCWKYPRRQDLDAIIEAIKLNKDRLISLDLAFKPNEKKEILSRFRILWKQIKALGQVAPKPVYLASLQRLTFLGTPIAPAVAGIINWETLSTLTLSHCCGLAGFLGAIVQSGCPVHLKILEIQSNNADQSHLDSLARFIAYFQGLESLYLAVVPSETMPFFLWGSIAAQRATLKRLILHHRVSRTSTFDLNRMGLEETDFESLHHLPSRNPLQGLRLEYLSVRCAPEYLAPMLISMDTRSLKFLHIRQSHSDCQTARLDWTASPVLPTEHPDASTLAPEIDEFHPRRYVQPEAVEFARWALGPHGLHALKLIAYGNFEESEHNERLSIDSRLFFSRVKNGCDYRCNDVLTDEMWLEDDEIFQLFSRGTTGYDDLVREHEGLLQACPESWPKNWA